MNKQQTIQILSNGIAEITYTDNHSVEHSAMVTMAPQHLPDTIETLDVLEKPHTIVAFNVNTERWESFSIHNLIDIEQLTGEGAAVNETKLQASPEYLEQFSLFSDEDLDTMEHPEDL
jgi:hypothetical protein